MINTYTTYDEGILSEGSEYNVGTNDGTMFNRAIFTKYKMHNGKKMMCFKTQESNSLVINPSYVCWLMEQDMTEINSVIARQAEDSWEQRIGERNDG